MTISVAILKPERILSSLSGQKLLQELDGHLKAGTKNVLIDFSDALFMDSMGLGYLISMMKRTKEANGEFYLCSVKGQAAMLLDLTGTSSILKIFADRAEVGKFIAQQSTDQ